MKRPNDKLILYIDIETTGLKPEYHQILEIGAKICDGVTNVEKLPTFHCYMLHDEIVGEPYTLWLNSKILKRIADREEGYKYYEFGEVAITHLRDFLMRNGFKPDNKITIGGKNFGAFDLQFLKRLPCWNLIKHRHRFVDPGMLWWNPEVDGTEVPNLKTCMERAGISG